MGKTGLVISHIKVVGALGFFDQFGYPAQWVRVEMELEEEADFYCWFYYWPVVPPFKSILIISQFKTQRWELPRKL